MPAFVSLREQLLDSEEEPTPRIHGLQAQGDRLLVAAQYKAGQTTLVGNMARSLVDGTPFLGRYPVRPLSGPLAVIDTEMSIGKTKAWLRDQGIVRDDMVIPISLRGRVESFNLLDDATRAAWAVQLSALGAQYLILDCLRPVLDALGLDEQREAGRFLVPFDALLPDAGISEALVVHHMGHQGERARGDSRLRDWPDAEIRLTRRDDDPSSERFLAAFGRDVDIPESRLVYDPVTRHLQICDGSRHDAAAREALADIVAVLTRARTGLSGREIKKALADSIHKRAAIEKALKVGEKDGSLRVVAGPHNANICTVPECPSVP
jgi:AAA domain